MALIYMVNKLNLFLPSKESTISLPHSLGIFGVRSYSCFGTRCCLLISSSFRGLRIMSSFDGEGSISRQISRNCCRRTEMHYSDKQQDLDPKPEVKLHALRQLFTKPEIGIDAYIIPSEDPHQSEFIADYYMRRAYITGFTGSAGTAVVTKDKAVLWTDGRYFLQAEKQLSPHWILMRAGDYGVPTIGEWLNEVLPAGCRIGLDPFLFSCDAAEDLTATLLKKNHELIYLSNTNLVDEIWMQRRTKLPVKPVRVHDIKYAGVDVSSKLSFLRNKLTEEGSTAIVISMLDEIAWFLNVRGNDVPHSPVAYAYLVVGLSCAKLFIDYSKMTPEVITHLSHSDVKLRPYTSILSDIERLASEGSRLWLDTSTVNAAIVASYKSACKRYFGQSASESRGICRDEISAEPDVPVHGPHGVYKASPVTLAKAVKNDAEIKGMKNAHLRDAAALANFWAWMEAEIYKNVALTEVCVAEKLLEFHMTQEGFLGASFDTISAFGANGAVIHYKPERGTCDVVDMTELFLLDSGAQYVDGTTDVTRTVHFGEPTQWQKECFTRVLQGHIALDQAVFPENTPGFVLDVLARSPLWKMGLDYQHGTGHGVGAALNVHEGPQSISYRYGNTTGLQKGMIVSNEPGYYEEHSFGIRIENLLYVKEVKARNCSHGARFLGFEKLTFVPIQNKMIDISLLSLSELSWLNDYHLQVWNKVSPLLEGSALQWLWRNTRPLLML